MKKIVIGIDPGKTGGFCIMSPNGSVSYQSSPIIGKEIDEDGYVKIIEEAVELALNSNYNIYAFLEDVHAIHGSAAGSTFEFGRSVGIIQGILKSFHVPTVKVKPKQWQQKMWSGVKIQKKNVGGKMKTDTKSTSLMAAKMLFPSESFLATSRSRVPHDGIVDATLIAQFGMFHYFTK